jgi:hypothetical protein
MTRFAEVARFAQSRPVASHRRVGALVIGGFRYNEGKPVVGSLLLGLYDSDGFLHHVGFTSTMPRDDKKALTAAMHHGPSGAENSGPHQTFDVATIGGAAPMHDPMHDDSDPGEMRLLSHRLARV